MASGIFPQTDQDPLLNAIRAKAETAQRFKKESTPQPKDFFGHLGDATALSLAEAVETFLEPAAAGVDALNRVSPRTTIHPITRTIQEGPMGAVLRTANAAQEQIQQAEQALKMQMMAEGSDTDATTRVQGNMPLRAPLSAAGAAINPMFAALGGMAPESMPIDASYTRSDASKFAGQVGRETLGFAAGAGATKAAIGGGKLAYSAKNMGPALEQFGTIKAAQKFIDARKFQVANVLEETVGGLTSGALESFTRDHESADGTYNPGETLKKAGQLALTYGLGGGLFAALGQVTKGIAADIASKALAREAPLARKPTPMYGVEETSKELGVDQLSGLRIEGPTSVSDPIVDEALRNYQVAAKRHRRALRQGPEDLPDAEMLQQQAEVELHAALEKSGLSENEYRAVWDSRNLTQTETGLAIPGVRRPTTLGSGLGGGEDVFRKRTQPKEAPIDPDTGKPIPLRGQGGRNKEIPTSPEDRVGSRGPAPVGDPASGMRAEQLAKKPLANEFADTSFMGADRLTPVERQVMIESLGEVKGTRFGRAVKDLSDTELLVVVRDAREKASREAATAGTLREQKHIIPTEAAVESRRQSNLKMVKNYHQSLTLEDVAAMSKTSVERVAGADPEKLASWLRTNSDKLKLQGVKTYNANRTLKPRNFATGAEHKAVADVLKKHGFLPEDVALALNAGFEPPASGIPSVDPINVRRAKPTRPDEANAIKAGAIYQMDAKALDQQLSNGDIGRQLRYLKSVAADMKTLPPEVQAKYPATNEGAIRFLNSQRDGKFTDLSPEVGEEMLQRKFHGDKVSFDEYAEGQDPFEQVVPDAPRKVAGTEVDPQKFYDVEFVTNDGQHQIARMPGDRIIQANEAGHFKEIKDISVDISPDQELEDAAGTYLGSGLGGGQKAYEKYIEKNMSKFFDSDTVARVKGMIGNAASPFSKIALNTTMITHLVHKEPSMNHGVDAVLDAVRAQDAGRKVWQTLTNSDRNWQDFALNFGDDAQKIIDQLVKYNVAQGKGINITPEQVTSDLAAIAQQLPDDGMRQMTKAYETFTAARSLAQQSLSDGIKQMYNYPKLPPEMQKAVDNFIKIKMENNANYISLSRKGKYKLRVTDSYEGKVTHWSSGHDTVPEFDAELAKLRQKYPAGVIEADDHLANRRKVYYPYRDKPEVVALPKKATINDDMTAQVLDAFQILPEELDVDLSKAPVQDVLKALIDKNTSGLAAPLQQRSYVPGYKTDWPTAMDTFRGLHELGTKLQAVYKVQHAKDDILTKVDAGLLVSNPKLRENRNTLMNDFLDNFLKDSLSKESDESLGALRSIAGVAELGFKYGFIPLNMTQRWRMSFPAAAAHGLSGVAHWYRGGWAARKYIASVMHEKLTGQAGKFPINIPEEGQKVFQRLLQDGTLGSSFVNDLLALSAQERKSIIKKLPLSEDMWKSAFRKVGTAGQVATAHISISDKYMKIADAFANIGIGLDKGYSGDDLYHFARREIDATDISYKSVFGPMAVQKLGPLKGIAQAYQLFWRYALEDSSRLLEATQDFMMSDKKVTDLAAALPEKLNKVKPTRADVGRSRLRLPAATAVTMLLGGKHGFNPATWLAYGGATAAGGGPLLASALKYQAEHNLSMPKEEVALKVLDPKKRNFIDHLRSQEVLNAAWDEQTNKMTRILEEAFPNGHLESARPSMEMGIHNAAGFNIGRSMEPQTVSDVVTNPPYIMKAAQRYAQGLDDLGEGKFFEGLGRLSSLTAGADEINFMIRTGKTPVNMQGERAIVLDALGNPVPADMHEMIMKGLRLESTKTAQFRMNEREINKITRYKEQVWNAALGEVRRYAVGGRSKEQVLAYAREKLPLIKAWNDVMIHKGWDKQQPKLMFDLEKTTDAVLETMVRRQIGKGTALSARQEAGYDLSEDREIDLKTSLRMRPLKKRE